MRGILQLVGATVDLPRAETKIKRNPHIMWLWMRGNCGYTCLPIARQYLSLELTRCESCDMIPISLVSQIAVGYTVMD
jgi:hypothetical protein